MILTRIVKEAQSAAAAANALIFPMMFLSGSFFPLEMMPGFLQTFARILPLYYVNEGLRASMVFVRLRGRTELRRDHRGFRGAGLRSGHHRHQMGRGQMTANTPSRHHASTPCPCHYRLDCSDARSPH